MSDAATRLVNQAAQARRENRLADARRDLVEAVALCRRHETRRELVQAITALGQIERDQGNGDAALRFYEEAVTICREDGDSLVLVHAIRHVGDIHQDAGHLNKAEPCYSEAIAIYRRHEQTSPLDLANAIRPLAILKDATGEAEEAMRLWKEAKCQYETAGVEAGIAECSRHLEK